MAKNDNPEILPDAIRIRGARQNNLKDIDVDIPLGKFTVVTGVSGSGKSSLAFDTLYAEGQRRYVETFSPYARQFLERLGRPQAEAVLGIPPAIAIDQTNPIKTSRSTVGTMTEINDHLKVLFAQAAVLHCDGCGQPVMPDDPGSIFGQLRAEADGHRALLGFPLSAWAEVGPERFGQLLRAQGVRRVAAGGEVIDLEDRPEAKVPDGAVAILDRVRINKAARGRITDSLEQALRAGLGEAAAVLDDGRVLAFSQGLHCAACDLRYDAPTPNLFSFNSPLGACPTCRGFGRTIGIDPDLVIPDPSLSLAEGAIKPWRTGFSHECQQDLMRFCRRHKVPAKKPWAKLGDRQRRRVWDGHGEFYGVAGYFEWLESRTYKMHVRVMLSRYRAYDRCTDCGGSRLRPEAARFRLGDQTLPGLVDLPIDRLADFFAAYRPPEQVAPAAGLLLSEIRSRLSYLLRVGVGYLTLDRQSRTLSGGEVQRVDLARALGSSLVNTLYVLDEPSIGLHPTDVERLIGVLHGLRDRGNTVVVVEHDRDIIRAADHLVDLGPGPGQSGGRVVYSGPPARIGQAEGSATARALSAEWNAGLDRRTPRPAGEAHVRIVGAAEHNLAGIDVDIPLGRVVAVTGVSGSGKSTLIHDVLYRGARKAAGKEAGTPGRCQRIEGLDQVADVVMVDQNSVPRTPGTNPVSYVKALTPIRQAFAATEAAVRLGMGPGAFSFRSGEGRCETCEGAGYEKVEMQFLSDVYLPCPECGGRRFREEVLQVSYRDKTIADVLELTVDEALEFLADLPGVQRPLGRLREVGLGYLRLGQPANTLSGGEAQRMKLAGQLGRPAKGGSLYLFDEPSTGLHAADVRVLIEVLHRLVDEGHTAVVIEHNLDIIEASDRVIDLGPGGGAEGGRIVCEGTPELISRHPDSFTGKTLSTVRGGPTVDGGQVEGPSFAGGFGGQAIRIEGARQHNLRDVTVELPRDKLIAVTGVSGSGKSSLAFDVLFAEGQRRYLDSVSAYARQFISQLPRPEVDRIIGVPPTVAVEQRTSRGSRRSTVATLSETYHFLRLLWSKAGVQHCPDCEVEVEPQSPTRIVNRIAKDFEGKRVRLLAPVVRARKGHHKEVMRWAIKRGFSRGRVDGRLVKLEPDRGLARYKEHDVEVEVARLPVGGGRRADLRRAVERALKVGDGVVMATAGRREVFYSTRGACPSCGRGFPALDPRVFSFNSPHGACPTCDGLGVVGDVDEGETETCPDCEGSRLRPAARAVKVGGRSLPWVTAQSVGAASRALARLRVPKRLRPVSDPLVAETRSRLGFLQQLGLAYLGLGRSGDSLSGGEAQRIRLAAQLGSTMRGVAYVVDEPTIGLHPRDSQRLIRVLGDLRDRGNTVVVVEHDEQTIAACDEVIDLGPGAGRHGGRVVVQGPPEAVAAEPASALSTRPAAERFIQVRGASHHNLKNLSVDVPAGRLTCVTGVSGSGKSSLVTDVLYRGVQERLGRAGRGTPGAVRSLRGWEAVGRALLVDQAPIGRTPRSTVATYVGLFDGIRKLFAGLPEARVRGYSPARFSFNVTGGRCEHCKGQGRVKVEMSFLPDVYVPCERCEGRRYNRETLAVRYRDHTIADVLAATAERALEVLGAVPELAGRLQMLCDIGLGYLALGQTSPTLSGGEAQRLKLVSELAKPGRSRSLYVLEEPTTGLHPADVVKLMTVLDRLVERGDTVVLVEHDMQVITAADRVIDLGPEGGDAGGRLVAAGSPAEVSATEGSHTARFLRQLLPASGPSHRRARNSA